MRSSIFKPGGLAAAVGAVALWSGSASAIPVTCVNALDDAYMTLGTNGSASVTCWDAGDQANPGSLTMSESGPGVFNDDTLNVPSGLTDLLAKSDGVNSSFFNIVSGSLTTGTSGTFTVDASGSLALLFKSGRGNNTPSWWLYGVQGLAAGELFSWNILGTPPINGLSHLSAYGGDTTRLVPEPTTPLLLGSGLMVLAAFVRRQKKGAESRR